MHDPAFENALFDLDDEFIFESDEDKVHGMIDRFMRDGSQKKNVLVSKSDRGRPRKHFTKKVTMIKMECFGPSIVIKAGRGRPGKNEKRIEISVPVDFEVKNDSIYNYADGRLEVIDL